MLYNYVNDVIKGEKNKSTAQKTIIDCVNRIWREYEKIVHKDESDKVKALIGYAYKDICEYVSRLELEGELSGIRYVSEAYLNSKNLDEKILLLSPNIKSVNPVSVDAKYAITFGISRHVYGTKLPISIMHQFYLQLDNNGKWQLFAIYLTEDNGHRICYSMIRGKDELQSYKGTINLDDILREFEGLFEVI